MRHIPRLRPDDTVLLVVDIQERLLPVIHEGTSVLEKSLIAVQAAKELNLPILLTEQYPRGLGKTAPELVETLGDAYRPIEKVAFSACGAEGVFERIGKSRNVLLAGIESHVCVLQTALDLLEGGYDVFPVTDAVSSRHPDNRALGLERMRQCGATLISTEILIFELLGKAGTPQFKALQKLIK